MSREARDWAWQQELTASAKIVLLALAEPATPDGHAYYSLKKLAAACGLNKATVIRQIAFLIDSGKLQKERGQRDNGSNSSTQYDLLMTTLVAQSDKGASRTEQPPLSHETTTLVALDDYPSRTTPLALVAQSDKINPKRKPVLKPKETTPRPAALQRLLEVLEPRGLETNADFEKVVRDKYLTLDLEEEAVKMLGWLEQKPGRKCTTPFVLNWLRGVDPPEAKRPQGGSNGTTPARTVPAYRRPGTTDSDIEDARRSEQRRSDRALAAKLAESQISALGVPGPNTDTGGQSRASPGPVPGGTVDRQRQPHLPF